MRCIFCKESSDGSRSVEHIVPESLGNTEHILPRGIVCDACNNYLSREVEAPFLVSGLVRDQRFQMGVPSKRGKIPPVTGIFASNGLVGSPLASVEFRTSTDEPGIAMSAQHERDEEGLIHALQTATQGTLYIPVGTPAEGSVVGRFVGKVGLEALAARVFHVPGGIDEVVDKVELDEIRSHVRRGYPVRSWPVHCRLIYATDHTYSDDGHGFEVLHEYDLLYTDSQELHVVLVIFGVEYVLNLGQPSLDGYKRWLAEHDGASPLYCGRNA